MQGMQSVVAVLIPDTSFRQKCWDIRCQWLLCISRLVSKHRQVMLDCTLGKTGNGEDHWCSSHKLINEVNTRACLLLYGQLGLLLPWRAFTWCICPTWVGTVGSCITFEEDSPGVFLSFSPRKNTQAMQDPPGLIDVRMVGTVRFWRSLPWVHGDLAGPFMSQSLPELISCSWRGLPQRRSECFLSHMRWRPHVISTSLDHLLEGV